MTCARCGCGVYQTEDIITLNKIWHKCCFTCYRCNKLLDKCSAKVFQGEVYCECCYAWKLEELEVLSSNYRPCRVVSSPSCTCAKEVKKICKPPPKLFDYCKKYEVCFPAEKKMKCAKVSLSCSCIPDKTKENQAKKEPYCFAFPIPREVANYYNRFHMNSKRYTSPPNCCPKENTCCRCKKSDNQQVCIKIRNLSPKPPCCRAPSPESDNCCCPKCRPPPRQNICCCPPLQASYYPAQKRCPSPRRKIYACCCPDTDNSNCRKPCCRKLIKCCKKPPDCCKKPPECCRKPPECCKRPPECCKKPLEYCRKPPTCCRQPPDSCRQPPDCCRKPPDCCKKTLNPPEYRKEVAECCRKPQNSCPCPIREELKRIEQSECSCCFCNKLPKYCICGNMNPCNCKMSQVRALCTAICIRCGHKVFAAEKISVTNGAYHTSCFSCYCCHKLLDVKNVFENCGEIYCKQCYNNFFGIQYYGY